MKFINNIKEGLGNPKKKSLVMLGIYLVFFIFVFAVIGGSNEPTPIINEIKEEKSTIENYKDMNSYEYKATFIENGLTNVIEGTYFNNTSLLNYNGLKYYYENDLMYLIDNDSYYLSSINYNVSKLFNKNLNILFDKLNEQYKTEYTDGTKEINYNLLLKEFYSYYYNQLIESDVIINVKVKEKDNFIQLISIDLSSASLPITKVEIEYLNINNISNLEFNKENYIYKEI